ncbi:uncharacterized protein LOC127613485 isoform X6 [Hippocampus zosterae]|uniref:uncharacterized protein LOC127613485 isoform X6 n=1 Tax=Hippocampus zosterae TaxID=109293 RepID=UPI00223E0CA3|nr:uncharacterized protein LOC127613485 isoform X6 [Hippocampus zosterae]
MELDLLSSSRALSPDSVSSDLDTSLLRDWLLDFRASSPNSAASVEKCSFSPDTMCVQNNRQHCNYYLSYSEDRPVSPQSSLSEVDFSDVSIKDLFNDSRPESPDLVPSENRFSANLNTGRQSHASPFPLADLSFLPPVFYYLHHYKTFISTLFDPLYKGKSSSFEMLLKFHAEQKSFQEPQTVSSCFALKRSHEIALTDKFTPPKYSAECTLLPYFSPKCSSHSSQECTFYESFSQSHNFVHIRDAFQCNQLSKSISVSPDASGLDQKCFGPCHDDIKPDSPKFVVFDSVPHQNMAIQAFSDCNLIPSTHVTFDSVKCLKHKKSEQCLIYESVNKDQRLLYEPFRRRLTAHIYDPVYRGKHVCNTVRFSVTDEGFEKTSEQSNVECLTAFGEEKCIQESTHFKNINSIKPRLNDARTVNNSQPELSYMPSVKDNMDICDTGIVTEAFSKQSQTRNETMEQRPLLNEHKGTDTLSPFMMTYSHDEFFKDMPSESLRMDKSSFLPADEMPDVPMQTTTEENYKDENGHIVVRKVTRKIIRKCVSSDGAEREEVLIEGSPQRSISVAEGDGYSKVVKRTVLKSEGDHTEVTFAESEGFSASQATAEVRKVSLAERTTVVEGKRTVTHKGDLSLASDLPSAQEDFNQALGYIGGLTREELPYVVESETVKDDGTVVRRAHMRKGQTLRRTVVQGGGQRKQVLLEQTDGPTKGSKSHELQQHLHQLFHHYYEHQEDHDDDDDDEEAKQSKNV